LETNRKVTILKTEKELRRWYWTKC